MRITIAEKHERKDGQTYTHEIHSINATVVDVMLSSKRIPKSTTKCTLHLVKAHIKPTFIPFVYRMCVFTRGKLKFVAAKDRSQHRMYMFYKGCAFCATTSRIARMNKTKSSEQFCYRNNNETCQIKYVMHCTNRIVSEQETFPFL